MQTNETMQPMVFSTRNANNHNRKATQMVIAAMTMWFLLTTMSQCIWIVKSKNGAQDCCRKTINSTFPTFDKNLVVPYLTQTEDPCFELFVNPEKTPDRFYQIIENQTLMHGVDVKENRLIFRLKLPVSLLYQEKLVAFSDVVKHIPDELSKDPIWIVRRVRIIYNEGSRTIIFRKCFNAAVIINEMIQLDISQLLMGAYATFISDLKSI